MSPPKPTTERVTIVIRLTPEANRALGVEAATRDLSRNAVVATAVYSYLGVPEPEAVERREARSQIAALADLDGEFHVENAMSATGLKRAACSHHLRALVRAGVLSERVLAQASGGRKAYRAAD